MKRSELAFSALTVPFDYLAIVIAGLLAYAVRYLPSVQSVRPVIFDLPLSEFLPVLFFVALIWVVLFALTGLYAIGATRSFGQEFAKIIIGCSAGLAIVLAVMVFSRYLFDSRFIILVGWVLSIISVAIGRFLIRLLQRLALRKGIGVHRVIVLGTSNATEEIISFITDNPSKGYRIVEHIASPDMATLQHLENRIRNDECDEIIHLHPHSNSEFTKNLVSMIDEYHLTYKYSADFLDTQLSNFDITTLGGAPIIEIKRTALDGWGRIYKRVFDVVASLVLIIVTSPIMLLAAIAIKLDSPGTVFFSYQRIGQYGKPFRYFKFRSMIKDAHKFRFDEQFMAQHKNLRDGTPMIKFADDPRITRVGRVLRRWSIDELPELFLVLIGTMSLVGPRPHEIEEVQRYQHHHKKLLSIKPGITGLAQVSGRSDLDFEEEVKLDLYYIEHWSASLDMHILVKTPLAVVKRRTAI